MNTAVYALADSALFKATPYHYALAALVAVQILRILLRHYFFARSVSWIPGPRALPLFGNALSLTGSQEDFYRLLLRCGQEYGRLFRLWIGMRPFVFLARADDIQPILCSREHIDKSFEYTFLKDWLGEGLITSTGDKWKRSRRLLTPAFHWDMLAEFAESIEQNVDILLSILHDLGRDQTIFNIMPALKLCTLDIICVTAMGKEVGVQKQSNGDYVKAVERITTVAQRRFITPWLKPDFLFKHSSLGKQQAKALIVVKKFVSEIIEAKKAEKKLRVLEETPNETGIRSKKAFLDLLLDANDGGADLTNQDLEDQVHTFMFAGHDTTATAVGWCLYVLGKHPEVQDKIVEEFQNERETQESSYQQAKHLNFLEICIKEAMRLYPVAPLIARDIKHPIQLSEGRVLPSGVTALIHLPLLHRDPTYFFEPDTFRPERFLLGGSDKTHPYGYIPFSAGPRNCIGQKFAQITTKLILAKILQRFHVTSMDPEERLNLISDIVLSNKEGINITLKPRET